MVTLWPKYMLYWQIIPTLYTPGFCNISIALIPQLTHPLKASLSQYFLCKEAERSTKFLAWTFLLSYWTNVIFDDEILLNNVNLRYSMEVHAFTMPATGWGSPYTISSPQDPASAAFRLMWLLDGAQLPTRIPAITQSAHSGLYTYIWAARAVTNPVYVVYNIYGYTKFGTETQKHISNISNLIKPIKNGIMFVFYLWLQHIRRSDICGSVHCGAKDGFRH